MANWNGFSSESFVAKLTSPAKIPTADEASCTENESDPPGAMLAAKGSTSEKPGGKLTGPGVSGRTPVLRTTNDLIGPDWFWPTTPKSVPSNTRGAGSASRIAWPLPVTSISGAGASTQPFTAKLKGFSLESFVTN